MKISLEWLREYLPGPLDAQAAGESLTHGGLPVESIETAGDDTVIDVEVTSNRADCLSYVGVAHELSALLDRPFRDATIALPPIAAPGSPPPTAVALEAGALCPHYTARVIENVAVAASPESVARRLSTMGSESKPVRPINNVVDVTNYVMYELGQPLHAFDLDKLEGGRIVVRRARAGEKLVTIDGKERALDESMLVIADAVRPVALAGVMGGLATEVTGSTRRILLESARFDPLSVRRTARALGMGSDSSYRFERGIDPTLPRRASARATQLIEQLTGGKAAGPLVEAGAEQYVPLRLTLRPERLKQVLGVDWPVERIIAAFARLRLAPVIDGSAIAVRVPSDRLDLRIEVDLIEEAARVIGYDQVPVRDEISIRVAAPDADAPARQAIFAVLCGAGYFEAVTFSFVTDSLAADFLPPAGVHPRAPLARAEHAVRKSDASLRPSLLPGLLEAIRRNESAGTAEPKLFEIGSAFWNDETGAVREHRRLTIAGGANLRDTRGAVEAILHRLDRTRPVRVIPAEHPGFARGGCGRIQWGDAPVGYLGKIDRAVAGKLSLRDLPAAAELDYPALLAGAVRVPQLIPPPRFPAVRRDLSLIVAETTPFEKIESALRGAGPRWLEDLDYVTTYRGKPLDPQQKSVTVTLVFRSPQETLTSDQVEASVAAVSEAAKRELGAEIRS